MRDRVLEIAILPLATCLKSAAVAFTNAPAAPRFSSKAGWNDTRVELGTVPFMKFATGKFKFARRWNHYQRSGPRFVKRCLKFGFAKSPLFEAFAYQAKRMPLA